MIKSDALSLLLQNNQIIGDQLEDMLYNTLILGVFEALCKDILKSGRIVEEKERFRKYANKTVAAKRLVNRYIGCCLSDEEYHTISIYLTAFFSKSDKRKTFDLSYKERLLKNQNHRCTICNSVIDLSNAHLDHRIPFHYVGDELPDNYQMLCETCNTRKGTATYFEISMLLLHHK